MTASADTVRGYETTRRWLASRLALWRRETGEEEQMLAALAEFCETVGKNPDELVDECLRRSAESGAYVLRTQARRRYIDRIDQFEADVGSRDAANAVRSFFIHNGVAMNPSILK